MLNQHECEQQLVACVEDMEAATEELRGLGEAAARYEVAYKVKFAQSRLSAEQSTDKAREADAVVNSKDELWRSRVAEERLRAQREVLHTLRARADALRSLLASIRGNT